ncbi:MAG: hypothetical protein E7522_03975 [Ruminococcaceae bacterium]|nr:hypothetical protein [Oscillospiraceae bacterium]
MKILKARNGIALVAVLTIMLISSMFIPVMFNLSDTSLMIAVKGTDRQRASYLARTVTEMSVAAFKKFDSIENAQLTSEQRTVRNGIDELLNGTRDKIEAEPIAMFSRKEEGTLYYKVVNGVRTPVSEADYQVLLQARIDILDNGGTPTYSLEIESSRPPEDPNKIVYVEKLYYSQVGSQDYNDKKAENSGFTYLGEAQCILTYEGGTKYYKKWTSDDGNGHFAGDVEELDKQKYDSEVQTYTADIIAGNTIHYELSSVDSKNVYFKSTATVNGISATRSCVLVLQTYPTEENWLQFKPESGGNQIFVDPDKATTRVPIEYDRGGDSFKDYQGQSLLVFSSIGNMIISQGEVIEYQKDSAGQYIKDANGNKIPLKTHGSGLNNSQFVLGVEPGLNTTPNNDPTFAIIDGANYDSNSDVAQMNNFVAFASTKAIRVDLPVNLLVNPCRANRLGDGRNKNASLYKILMFQAPDIIFEGSVDMMMSFYVPSNNQDARRMSSVVLNAPSSTPYHYEHDDYGTVKAGRVFFAEDSYLWIIPYGDDGSASSWSGFLSETVYERDSDFQKIKIANAGDVYYFNAEVTQTRDVTDAEGNGVDSDGDGVTDTITDFVGFSLTGYILETKYLPNYQDENSKKWWNVWNNTQAAIFGAYMEGQLKDSTYVEDDFHYIGNLNDGVSLIEYPEVDDYYVIWEN